MNPPAVILALTALLLAADAKPAFQHSAPAQAKPNEPLQVDGSLTGGEFKDVILLYRGPGQDYVEAKMEIQYGDLYRAVIPAARMVPPGVEYYVEGRKNGERIPLFMTARKPARVLVLAPDGEAPPQKKFDDEAPLPPPAPQPQRGASLDEELAVYSAEYPAGYAVSLEPKTRKTPQNVYVLTFAQLKAAGVRHVYEALDLFPGMAVSRDVQGFYRAAVRGIRDEAGILYLYDGHPLNTFHDGRALAWVPIDNLERIELIRGPASALDPAGNFIALVNLVPNRKAGVRAGFQAGLNSIYGGPPANPQAPPAPGRSVDQRGSLQGHLAASHTFDVGLSLALDADALKDNGYYKPIVADGLKLATPAGHTLDRRTLVNVGAAASFTSKQTGTLTLKGRYLDETRTPLVGQFDVTTGSGSLRWQAVLVDGLFEKQMTREVGFKVHGWFSQQNTDRLFHQTPPGFPTSMHASEGLIEQVRVGERVIGLQAVVDFLLPMNNRLFGGVRGEYAALYDYALLSNFAGDRTRQQPLDVMNPLEAGTGVASRRLWVGLFLMDEWRPIERITVQGGVRFEIAQLPTANAMGQVDGAQLALGLSPRIAVAFAPLDNLVLKAHYARGFRAPTVEELALDLPDTTNNQGRVVGNPALTPAYLDQVEASLEYLFGISEARARVRAGGFYDKFTSPIVPVDTTGNQYAVRNRTDGVQAYGLEAEARLELGRGGAWANLSWVRVEDLGTVETAYLVTETPQLRFNGGFSVPLGPFLAADVFATVHGERRSNARSVLELLRRYRLPPYALVGFQVRTEALLEHVELSFMVRNLFDVDYADDAPRPDRITDGVPREGVNAMLGARVFF